jgi:nucleoside-diphosphate-sugar epimerase
VKVLIIGGTGLISTEIVRQLVERGEEVAVFNRGRTPIRWQGPVEVLQGNRWEPGSLENAVAGRTWDAVIDMAAFAPENGKQLRETFWGRSGQVVLCSTTCVYGGPSDSQPLREDCVRRPFGHYGINKARIEALLLEGSGQQGTGATILRPSYTTGEGATACGLLFDDSLVSRMRAGLRSLVMDDGTCPWAIAHVSDVARGFVNALGNPKAYGNDYHLTSDEHTDWNGVYRTLARAAGAPDPELVHVPSGWLRQIAPRRSLGVWFIYRFPSVYDNSKAAADLGFRTTVPLVETFRRQIAWMEAAGALKRVDEEPCQDLLIDAWEHGREWLGDKPGWVDWNPWGNGTEN